MAWFWRAVNRGPALKRFSSQSGSIITSCLFSVIPAPLKKVVTICQQFWLLPQHPSSNSSVQPKKKKMDKATEAMQYGCSEKKGLLTSHWLFTVLRKLPRKSARQQGEEAEKTDNRVGSLCPRWGVVCIVIWFNSNLTYLLILYFAFARVAELKMKNKTCIWL